MNSDAKSKRRSIRASPSEYKIVRRMAEHNRMPLDEKFERSAAAFADLTERRLFMLSAKEWKELQMVLHRTTRAKPRLKELLTHPSVLETEGN